LLSLLKRFPEKFEERVIKEAALPV
jgi:hypothetical protein